MHVPYTCGLLVAANEQRHGFIKLRGAHADHEVRLMVQAGLVDATFSEDNGGAFASINRVCAAGQVFLHRTHGEVPATQPDSVDLAPMTATQAAVVTKWKARLGLPLPELRLEEISKTSPAPNNCS